MKNNIFTYATSELTNDAILCWILSFADNKDSNMAKLSNDFIKLLTNEYIDVKEIMIRKQHLDTDIIVEINDDIVIMIEDKIYSLETGNQLEKYKKSVLLNYPNRTHYFIYLTIGDEDNYERMKKLNYSVITRKDMIKLIDNYTNDSDILFQYHEYLGDIEKTVNSYQTRPIKDWSQKAWQGFYDHLKRKGIDGSWSYVPNQSGGFMAFYWCHKKFKYKSNIEYSLYLQIEQKKICFKVSDVSETSFNSKVQKYLSDAIMSIIPPTSNIIKPRLRTGVTMTFACIDNYQDIISLENAVLEAERMMLELHSFITNDTDLN